MSKLNMVLACHVRRWTSTLSLLVSAMLCACQAPTEFVAPEVDRVRFKPAAASQRTIDEPKVKFLPRADGYEYCARITGIPMTPTSRPMACAFWNVRRKECSIVTPISTGYNYLGHELRHCFEGAFHD